MVSAYAQGIMLDYIRHKDKALRQCYLDPPHDDDLNSEVETKDGVKSVRKCKFEKLIKI
jgi:hypothetical protein